MPPGLNLSRRSFQRLYPHTASSLRTFLQMAWTFACCLGLRMSVSAPSFQASTSIIIFMPCLRHSSRRASL